MRHEYSEAGSINDPFRSCQPQSTFWPQRLMSLSHTKCIHSFLDPTTTTTNLLPLRH